MNPQTPCAHCGLPVPPSRAGGDEGPRFCCGGCEQVYRLLHDNGLEDFYRVREQVGSAGQPARVKGRAFLDFDDDVFIGRYTSRTARGTRVADLYVEGVHCVACAWLLERLGERTPGVVSLRLDIARARVRVEWEPDLVALSTLAQAMDELGYTPHPWREADLGLVRRAEDRRFLLRIGVAAAAAMNIMFLHVALYAGEHSGIEPAYESLFKWASLLLALPVVTWAAWPFLRSGVGSLRRRLLHIDLPIALAIEAGFLASARNTVLGHGPVWFDSITMLTALLLGGRWLQATAQRRALETAERLHGDVLVDFARRREADGALREIPTEALRPGDLLVVRSGESVPADGIVVEGRSRVDDAALTGESAPRPVGPDDVVYAHTVNIGAELLLRSTAVGTDTRVGALLALVEEARRRQAPIVALTDRVGRVFVAVLLVVAALAGAWWSWTLPEEALERVIALLVVACPCALGLATPVAMTTALTQAANAGIFIKGADVVQALSRVREVIFDKTGTLTEGRVTLVRWQGDAETRALAASLARHSVHPIARALADASPAATASVEDMRELPGHGMRGRVGGRDLVVGSLAWISSLGLSVPQDMESEAEALARAALSPVLVAVDGRVLGLAGLGDPLRPEAPGVVRALEDAGWKVRILSGDHPSVARVVGEALGLPPEAVQGGRSPEAKLAFVQERVTEARARGRLVMMVGDGINDAAALSAADIGVCVAGGSGASIQAADILLQRPGLFSLPLLEAASRRALRVVLRNLAFSLVYNVVTVSLALLGHVGPLLAAVLMPISSLTVIGSSVLARTFASPGTAGRARAPAALEPATSRPGAGPWK